MKTSTQIKLTLSVISLTLCAIIACICCLSSVSSNEAIVTVSALERRVVLTNDIDADAVLNKYEDSSFKVDGTLGTFDGYQSLDVSMLSDLDEISETEREAAEKCRVHYSYTYDVATNVVTLFAEMSNEYGEILIDTITGLAFTDENGNVDAVLDIDGEENILLSDLLANNSIENVGWLSRFFKRVAVAVATAVTVAVAAVITVATAGVGAVATVATATAVISGTAYAAGVGIYEQTQAYQNYKHNQKLDHNVNGTVNGQGNYSNWRFGARTFDHNGCGVIATYNVMYLLGRKEKLSQVAYDIERKQGTLAFGYLGTDPTHPLEYFLGKGIRIKQYYMHSSFEKALKNMRKNQYAIVSYWNDKNNKTGEGSHFVALSKENTGEFRIYNAFYSMAVTDIRNNLSGIMRDGKGQLITGFIIN